MFQTEQMHPAADMQRHAQLTAAILTGAATKRDRSPWTAAEFMPADPWKALEPKTKLSRAQVRAQVRALNERRKLH